MCAFGPQCSLHRFCDCVSLFEIATIILRTSRGVSFQYKPISSPQDFKPNSYIWRSFSDVQYNFEAQLNIFHWEGDTKMLARQSANYSHPSKHMLWCKVKDVITCMCCKCGWMPCDHTVMVLLLVRLWIGSFAPKINTCVFGSQALDVFGVCSLGSGWFITNNRNGEGIFINLICFFWCILPSPDSFGKLWCGGLGGISNASFFNEAFLIPALFIQVVKYHQESLDTLCLHWIQYLWNHMGN